MLEFTCSARDSFPGGKLILTRLAQAEAEALGLSAAPSGTLKIGVTASFDRHHLTCLVSSYLEQYPQVSVNVMLAQQISQVRPP
ncbi:hypothetical protein GNZ13_13615 [Paraburkholderia sp. 5N]|uniref:LysR substrate-binding domain-containing protein n=1 Tax=Paraburkholderia elongata TaxID=2675747 RepID=A0A972NLE9_9BURK|nr:hypothetical protein [Paraburkholderia elongata]